MTEQQALALLSGSSGGIILAFVLVTGFLGYWVYGRTFDLVVKDRDYWRDLALRSMDAVDRLTGIMESSKRGRG